MPGKGRAEHGGGPAKWRHGWIPANAAARAVVAAREARKAEPFVKAPRKRPTEEDSSVVDETTQTLLRSPDVASGTPSLFRGRRNIVDSAPPPFLGKMAHIQGPHSPEDDSVNANPGYYSTEQGLLGYSARESLHQHQVNCYNCVQAYELRRRGYAVQAGPAQLNWYGGSGKTEEEIAAGWKTQDGTNAEFTDTLGSHGMMATIDQWPPGSRGWISNQWKDQSSGHIFAVEKDAQGKVHFYDPQPGGEVTDYLDKSTPTLAFMRTDNLVPTEVISERVEPSSVVSGTWRPSKKEMGTPLTEVPGMKKWLDAQTKLTQEKLDALSTTPRDRWQREVTQARLDVYQQAAESTPGTLEDKILVLKGIEQEQHDALGDEPSQDDYEAYKITHVQLTLMEEILHKAVPNATGLLVSGTPVTPGRKVEKRWRQ